MSYIVGYLDLLGRQVFLVHLYLRPNGDLGGSGQADPKWLRDEEAIYFARA